jgi:hypothetical protein
VALLAACGSDATGPSIDGGQDLLLAPVAHTGLHRENGGHGLDDVMPPVTLEDETTGHQTGTEQK